jgi:hypothetical protein
MPRRTAGQLRLFAALAALFLALFVAACGGSDSDSDGGDSGEETAISEVIVSALTENDAEAVCNEWSTADFVEAVYGDIETCVKEAESESDDPEDVSVTDIEIDGDSATATVTEVGGESDGATGTVTVVKVDGSWRIDDLGIDFLRSLLREGLAKEAASGDDPSENPFANPEIADCIEKGMDALSDKQFRQIAYDGMAGREPNEDFIKVLTDCISGAGA